jgi:hypothetical protein
MPVVNTRHWNSLESWSPVLFVVGFLLELGFALNHGAAYLVETVTFVDWIYPSVLLGRFAVLLGLAGLSVPLTARHPRLGKLSRIVLALAMLFTLILISLSILDIVGFFSFTDFVATPVLAVFGIGTVALTMLSFLIFGVAGLRTDAYPTVIGGLMLISTLAILFVLLGSGTFSTNVRGAVGEGLNALVFLAIWYVLSTESKATTTTEEVSNTQPE